MFSLRPFQQRRLNPVARRYLGAKCFIFGQQALNCSSEVASEFYDGATLTGHVASDAVEQIHQHDRHDANLS